jgi:hypothetical protein
MISDVKFIRNKFNNSKLKKVTLFIAFKKIYIFAALKEIVVQNNK